VGITLVFHDMPFIAQMEGDSEAEQRTRAKIRRTLCLDTGLVVRQLDGALRGEKCSRGRLEGDCGRLRSTEEASRFSPLRDLTAGILPLLCSAE
jgi:hypothetical protein